MLLLVGFWRAAVAPDNRDRARPGEAAGRATRIAPAAADRPASQLSRKFIYPFFLLHMLAFGVSGFVLAYAELPTDVLFLYMHGGIAIAVYIAFYLVVFGVDDVKWMFINAGLGIMGIYSQIGWILARFGRRIDDYPVYVHVVPFLYYVLYTFLLRQLVLDIAHARSDPRRRRVVEGVYVAGSLAFYAFWLVLR